MVFVYKRVDFDFVLIKRRYRREIGALGAFYGKNGNKKLKNSLNNVYISKRKCYYYGW